MKYLVKTPKTTLTRLDAVERARAALKSVADSNPLNDSERVHVDRVLILLSVDERLHMRPDALFDEEELVF